MHDRRVKNYSLGLVLLTTASACPAVVNLRAVAYNGQTAPGVDGATLGLKPARYSLHVGSRDEAIGPSGAVTFVSDLDGDGFSGTYNQALWLWDNGVLTLLARTGQPLPGLVDETLTQFNWNPSIDASSRVAFLGTTDSPGTAVFEAAVGPDGAPVVTPVFRAGDVLPDDPRPVVDFAATPVRPFRVSPSGNYVIGGTRYDPAKPPSADGGNPAEGVIVVGRPGQLATVMRLTYSPAPDSWSGVDTAGITDGGRPVLTVSSGTDSAGTAGNTYTILAPAADGGFRTVAATGDPAPTTGGTLLIPSATPSRGPAVAITSYAVHTHSDGTDPTYDFGVWVDRGDGNLTLVARYDDPAAGTSETFQYVHAAAVSSSGDVLITGDLGADDATHGLWLWRDGLLTSLAIIHDDAAGPRHIVGVHVNEAGQVVFAMTEHGETLSGISYDAMASIWGGPTDAPAPLVSLGDTVDVDGVPHVITGLDLADLGVFGDASGGPTVFNDAGQLLFAAQLDDGAWGIFVASVPEPTGAAVLLVTATTVMTRRRRSRV